MIIKHFLFIYIILVFRNCIFYCFSINFVESLKFLENFWLRLSLFNIGIILKNRFLRKLKMFSIKYFFFVFINFFFVNSNSFSCQWFAQFFFIKFLEFLIFITLISRLTLFNWVLKFKLILIFFWNLCTLILFLIIFFTFSLNYLIFLNKLFIYFIYFLFNELHKVSWNFLGELG